MNPSSSQPHLQIFNSIKNTNIKDSCFLHFRLLPTELRLKIWRHALQRERIIKVSFDLCSIKPSDVNIGLRESFIQTLTQLQEVFFVELVGVGHQILGTLIGIASNEVILNRSMPIAATAPTFDRLHQDPRPIVGDLEDAYIGEGPLRMLYV